MVYIVSFSSRYQDPSMNTLQCILFFPFFSGLSFIFGLRFVILKKKWIRAMNSSRFCIILIFFCKNPTSFFCLYFDFFFVVVNSTLNKVRKGLPNDQFTKLPVYELNRILLIKEMYMCTSLTYKHTHQRTLTNVRCMYVREKKINVRVCMRKSKFIKFSLLNVPCLISVNLI